MDKILVFGDSIVYGKWDSEGGWVSILRKYVDKNYNIGKNGNFLVYNLGVPSELAIGLEKRFANELDKRINPDEKCLVVIATGVNDSCPNNRYSSRQTPVEEFKTALKTMASYAIKKDCQVIFIGLLSVNPAKSKGLLFTNEEVMKYDQYITEVCDELNIKKLELFNKLSGMGFSELLVDSAHPNSKGHLILSENIIAFLQEQKIITHQ